MSTAPDERRMERPVLVDEFCGAGGATAGYQAAGFYVVGVDKHPQPHYCGDEFIQMDALEHLATADFSEVAAIHASPPCQAYTTMSNRHGRQGPDLIATVRNLLEETGKPWVMENVLGAKRRMRSTFSLSGGMFGLGVHRERLFESNVLILSPGHAPKVADPVGVYGKAPDGRRLFDRADGTTQSAARSLEEAQEAMGMDWADWHGTKEAIPPSYAEFIGHQLLAHIGVNA